MLLLRNENLILPEGQEAWFGLSHRKMEFV